MTSDDKIDMIIQELCTFKYLIKEILNDLAIQGVYTRDQIESFYKFAKWKASHDVKYNKLEADYLKRLIEEEKLQSSNDKIEEVKK